MSRRLLLAVLSAPTFACLAFGVGAQEVSEKDYFGDLPVVLSVSRLAQPLDETPGAVTVLDRDMIRRSGARDLSDLLRLVPGFVIGHLNGANPLVNYHGDYDGLNRRLQIFVDGRSIYSTMLAGNVSHPMLGVVLDDIERVEVLRGSNSAGYGANAFLGVINVVTRNAADVPRASFSVALGEKGIADRSARVAWGDERMAFRVTAARNGDNGFDNVFDDLRVDQLHVRGDLHPSLSDDVMVSAGSVRHQWGATDMLRSENWRNAYVQGRWVRHMGNGDEFRVNASFDEEKFVDQIFYISGRPFRADGTGRRLSLEAEQATALTQGLRLVWGGQLRHEEVYSPDLLFVSETQTMDVRRFFGNIEWRPHRQWVVNAGAMWEDHSIVGPRTSPRLAVNYHVLPDHTIRVGTTQAYRSPTLYELRGDWRTPTLAFPLVRAKGQVKPERLVANEIGYLGEFRSIGLSVDLRGFDENGSSVARYFGFAAATSTPNDVVNKDAYRKRGWETQIRWRPRHETQLLFNHTVLKSLSITTESDRYVAPTHQSSLVWFESLPGDWDWSLAYHIGGPMTWSGMKQMQETEARLDLRLARRFKTSGMQGEVALVTQSATGRYQDGDPARYFPRRTFASLRLDF